MSLCSNPNIQNPLPMNNSILQNTNFSYENSDFAEIQSTVVPTSHVPDKKMMYELEKKLHEDIDDEEEWSLVVSGIMNTNNEWSETIRNLNSFEHNPIQKPISFSPPFSTTSLNSSPSSIVSPASEFSKQSLMEAATAISEGKMDYAKEILSSFSHTQNPKLKFDSWLLDCIASALKSRVNNIENPPPVAELFSKEHTDSTQLLFDNSLCFKLSFMAANIAILEAAFKDTTKSVKNLCVVDFDIGNGKQYINLLQELHARLNGSPAMLKITTVTVNIDNENLKTIGELLVREAKSLGIGFEFKPVNLKLTELTRESLNCNSEDILAVNFAFNLCKIPDESVSTENPRDTLLRQVKSLSPSIVTILEQELNTNTALFVSRVAETLSYYNTLLESIEFAMDRGSYKRLKLEKGLSRKMRNVVACEGRDRVERCEVFGKWRARMSMAGFRLNPMSRKVTESITSRLIQGSRITVHEENGGVCFGWKGKALTVASSWC
ncbi:scarecrow-like protein 8 [Medicago truncatula]|nr:scarecrow-like protein 8 [Medicago truncatula]